jgi:hypothetical protein
LNKLLAYKTAHCHCLRPKLKLGSTPLTSSSMPSRIILASMLARRSVRRCWIAAVIGRVGAVWTRGETILLGQAADMHCHVGEELVEGPDCRGT